MHGPPTAQPAAPPPVARRRPAPGGEASGGAAPVRAARAPAPSGAQAGFTLLEVLVATVVLGLLLAGLAGGTRLGVRAWATQERVVARRAQLDAVDRTLRTLIGGMDPGYRADPPGIRGTAHAMVFTATLPQGATLAAGVSDRRAEVRLEVDASHRLLLRWTPAVHARRLSPPPLHETVLLDGVAGLDLAFWRESGGGAWLGAWEGRAPPSLVRLRIVPDGGGSWPAIVVAPRRAVADD